MYTIYLLTNANSQTTININLSWHSSRCQEELAALLVSVRSNSRRKMGLTLSLNNELFSEKIPYIQLNAKIKDRASCIER